MYTRLLGAICLRLPLYAAESGSVLRYVPWAVRYGFPS